MADKVKIGLIGCGGLCSGYADRLVHSEIVEIAACADIIPEKAIQMAETVGIPKSCTVRELLEDPELLAHYKEKAAQRGKSFSTENTVKAVEEMLRNLG